MIERLMPAGGGRMARVRCSDRSDGDFRCNGDSRPLVSLGPDASRRRRGGDPDSRGEALLDSRRQALMSGRWTWLRQVHGADVVVVTEPGAGAGAAADGAVTIVPEAVLAVHTADCTPVVVTGGGALGVAHAGWRGIAAGLIGEVVEAVRAAGAEEAPLLRALLGPMIRPARYEFGAAELALVAEVAGCDVAGVTAWGTPALDLAAAVRGALRAAGVSEVEDLGLDTARECYFSYRVRGDTPRQAMAVKLEPKL